MARDPGFDRRKPKASWTRIPRLAALSRGCASLQCELQLVNPPQDKTLGLTFLDHSSQLASPSPSAALACRSFRSKNSHHPATHISRALVSATSPCWTPPTFVPRAQSDPHHGCRHHTQRGSAADSFPVSLTNDPSSSQQRDVDHNRPAQFSKVSSSVLRHTAPAGAPAYPACLFEGGFVQEEMKQRNTGDLKWADMLL